MVADAVERFDAQVQWRERDVGTPLGMVEPAVDVDAEGVFAGVATGAVPAVVPQGDGLRERRVQPQHPGHRHRHLGHLERMGEPRALVVVGEHEHLRLARQAAEGSGVEDAIAVAFETGAPRIGLFLHRPVAGLGRASGQRGQGVVLGGFASAPVE